MSDNVPFVGGIRNLFSGDCTVLFFILVFLLLFTGNTRYE